MFKIFGLGGGGPYTTTTAATAAAAATEASTKRMRDTLAMLERSEEHFERKCQDETRAAKARMAEKNKRGTN